MTGLTLPGMLPVTYTRKPGYPRLDGFSQETRQALLLDHITSRVRHHRSGVASSYVTSAELDGYGVLTGFHGLALGTITAHVMKRTQAPVVVIAVEEGPAMPYPATIEVRVAPQNTLGLRAWHLAPALKGRGATGDIGDANAITLTPRHLVPGHLNPAVAGMRRVVRAVNDYCAQVGEVRTQQARALAASETAIAARVRETTRHTLA